MCYEGAEVGRWARCLNFTDSENVKSKIIWACPLPRYSMRTGRAIHYKSSRHTLACPSLRAFHYYRSRLGITF
jgi:hypothetical protein